MKPQSKIDPLFYRKSTGIMAGITNHLQLLPVGVDDLLVKFHQERKWHLELAPAKNEYDEEDIYYEIRGWIKICDDYRLDIAIGISPNATVKEDYDFHKEAFFQLTKPSLPEWQDKWQLSPLDDFNCNIMIVRRDYTDDQFPFQIISSDSIVEDIIEMKAVPSVGSFCHKFGWSTEPFFRRLFELAEQARDDE